MGPRPGATVLLGLCVLATGCGSFAARGLNAGGVRKFEQARYQEAIQDFQQAIYNDPNNADGYYNLAAAYHRLASLEKRKSDYDQAESYYNQCLDRNGDHAECYRGLAVLLAEQGRKEEAFRLIEGWVDRRGDLAEPRIELARLLQETGRTDLAKERLAEALTRDPNNSRALAALGSPRDDRRACPGTGRLSALARAEPLSTGGCRPGRRFAGRDATLIDLRRLVRGNANSRQRRGHAPLGVARVRPAGPGHTRPAAVLAAPAQR